MEVAVHTDHLEALRPIQNLDTQSGTEHHQALVKRGWVQLVYFITIQLDENTTGRKYREMQFW